MPTLLPLMLLAIVQTSPPPAGDVAPTASAKVATPAAASDSNKIVCRRTANTGSRLGGAKECLTNAQWREREALNAELVRGIQDRSRQAAH